jgi:hypothetical protein
VVKIFWQTGQENIGCGVDIASMVVAPPRVGPSESVGTGVARVELDETDFS